MFRIRPFFNCWMLFEGGGGVVLGEDRRGCSGRFECFWIEGVLTLEIGLSGDWTV